MNRLNIFFQCCSCWLWKCFCMLGRSTVCLRNVITYFDEIFDMFWRWLEKAKLKSDKHPWWRRKSKLSRSNDCIPFPVTFWTFLMSLNYCDCCFWNDRNPKFKWRLICEHTSYLAIYVGLTTIKWCWSHMALSCILFLFNE